MITSARSGPATMVTAQHAATGQRPPNSCDATALNMIRPAYLHLISTNLGLPIKLKTFQKFLI
jgi:hypothetical protein